MIVLFVGNQRFGCHAIQGARFTDGVQSQPSKAKTGRLVYESATSRESGECIAPLR